MLLILSKICVIFAIAGVGFGANRLNILPDQSRPYLIALLVNITSPCMLITSITSRELTASTFSTTIEVLIGTAVFFAGGILLSWILVKQVFLRLTHIPSTDQGVYMNLLTSINMGFMGFPLSKAAFGNEALYFMAIGNIILNIYLYSAGLLQLNMGSGKFKGMAATLKPMLNPNSIAAVLGIILLFAGIPIPSLLNEFLTYIGDITIPLSMIVVGVQLGGSKIRRILINGRLLLLAAFSLILWPLLTFLAVNWLPLDVMTKLTLVYAASFPPAVITVALAGQEGQNAQLAAEGVALTTLLSLATLPVVTLLLSSCYGV